MSTTQAQERTAIVKASSERVRAWLVSGCAGKPPLIDIAAMRELVEMMLATPPSPAAPQGVVAWEYEANYIPHPDRDDGIHVTRWKVEAEVNGLTGSIKPLVYAQSAGEQTGPVPARPAPVEVEALKFDIRQAMIEYGSAFKRNDEQGVRETSTRCCALLDQLASVAAPQAMDRDILNAALTAFAKDPRRNLKARERAILLRDSLTSLAQAENEDAALLDVLRSIWRYGADTLSGRADGGPDDREWQRGVVVEMTKRAGDAIRAARKDGK
jgi:hypothetical protein